MKTAFVLKDYIFDVEKLEQIMGDLREVKAPFELNQLKRAIEISAIGQVEVMKALHPGMSERRCKESMNMSLKNMVPHMRVTHRL